MNEHLLTATEIEDAAALDDERRSQRQAEQARADMAWLLGHAAGRRIVWRLLDGVNNATFSTDSAAAAFLEGRRARATELMAEVMRTDLEAYFVMVREHSGGAA